MLDRSCYMRELYQFMQQYSQGLFAALQVTENVKRCQMVMYQVHIRAQGTQRFSPIAVNENTIFFHRHWYFSLNTKEIRFIFNNNYNNIH